MTDWGIKYKRNEIVQLTKQTGETVEVRIEGVSCYKGQPVIYDTREVDTGVSYPAEQSSLRKGILKYDKSSLKKIPAKTVSR